MGSFSARCRPDTTMPPGIFEGSPWLGDTVEFTRMPLTNIPRIPSQIHEREPMLIGRVGRRLLRFEGVDAIVTMVSPAVRGAPQSTCPTARRSAPSPMIGLGVRPSCAARGRGEQRDNKGRVYLSLDQMTSAGLVTIRNGKFFEHPGGTRS